MILKNELKDGQTVNISLENDELKFAI